MIKFLKYSMAAPFILVAAIFFIIAGLFFIVGDFFAFGMGEAKRDINDAVKDLKELFGK